MVAETKDMVKDAKGMMEEFLTKQKALLAVEDKALNKEVIDTLLGDLGLFKNFADKRAIKSHVEVECQGRREPDIIEACQMLAFTSLMIDLEEEKFMWFCDQWKPKHRGGTTKAKRKRQQHQDIS